MQHSKQETLKLGKQILISQQNLLAHQLRVRVLFGTRFECQVCGDSRCIRSPEIMLKICKILQ